MPSTKQPFVRLAQISDLHFVKELTEKGRMHFLKQFLTKSHAFAKVDALSRRLAQVQVPYIGTHVEVLLATGDISTDGATDALQTALTFIENQDIKDDQGAFITVGLNKSRGERLVLPGNHDRYTNLWFPLQTYSTELEKVFQTPTTRYYSAGYRPSAFTSDSEPALLFFVFDSTLNPNTSSWRWNRVARGRIEDADCRKMLQDVQDIKNSGEVDGINGGRLTVDYDNSFRIALLHHHPQKKGTGMVGSFGHITKMENARLFIEYCFDARIDLILFGHQHKEYHDTLQAMPNPQRRWRPPPNSHDIYYFCCQSTSEYSEKINGFYLIDFYQDEFRVIPYHWNGASFVKQGEIPCPYKRKTF